jgi:HPt (histidine-containing phosphotransfer) domain-containing protein
VDSIVDKASLLERLDGDHELLVELIELFVTDCPQWLEEIRGAVTTGDAARLTRAAHTLKGSVSNFCAPRAAETLQCLESLGRDANIVEAPPALARLESILERLCAELHQLAPGVAV